MDFDEAAVREALRTVDDPEAGMNIVDLGLVYGVAVEPGTVRVQMTMTSAACPLSGMMVDAAHEAVASVAPAGTQVAVDLVWDPPWSPEKMSGTAREFFGWKG
jgi:metal-sulfur cluster biosynthetic enzyme